MEDLRTGIVGLGKMGRHHVRCVEMARGLALVGGTDIDGAKAETLPSGALFTSNLDALIAECDALVLAVPTDRHEELGAGILAAGRHLLVEKPLASTARGCRALADAAAAAGVTLGVGHVERFNGAYRQVADRVGRPRFVEGHRLAGYDPRGTEVDVVLDLMIHDLDLVLDRFGADPVHVDAVGVAVLSDRVDIANARLEFPGGGLANLTSSRVSRDTVRKIRFFQGDAYFSLDLKTQEVEVFSRDPRVRPWGVACEKRKASAGHNPLVAELEAFAAAAGGASGPTPLSREPRRGPAERPDPHR